MSFGWVGFGLKGNFSVRRAKSSQFCIQPDTPMPRQMSLHLGEPEPKVYALSGPPRHSCVSPRRTFKSCFGSSLPLILTIIH